MPKPLLFFIFFAVLAMTIALLAGCSAEVKVKVNSTPTEVNTTPPTVTSGECINGAMYEVTPYGKFLVSKNNEAVPCKT